MEPDGKVETARNKIKHETQNLATHSPVRAETEDYHLVANSFFQLYFKCEGFLPKTALLHVLKG